MKKLILVAGVLALLGAGCAQPKTEVLVPLNEQQDAAPVPAIETSETTIKNAIVVTDQKLGDEAMIDTVSIEQKGYVVVHEDDNGMAGMIVGHSDLLNTGETKSVKVVMKVHADLSHIAMLHMDNGDGVYDEKQDLPIKNENGEFIMMAFKGMGEAMKKVDEMM